MKIHIENSGGYRVYLNGDEEWSFFGSSTYLIFKGDYVNLFNRSKEKELYVRVAKSGWIWGRKKTTYLLSLIKEKRTIELKCLDYFKGHWIFQVHANNYDLYFHQGHKRSLYKNGIQVARFDKQVVSYFGKETAVVLANSDEHVLVLIGLFIAFDMGSNSYGSTIAFDFGQLNDGVIDEQIWNPTK